jgi:hypothetical protein
MEAILITNDAVLEIPEDAFGLTILDQNQLVMEN